MKKTSRAGVSDTRAGLQPAGLYSSAGLFKKGFQDFHPLDASPYLLFDASKSMVGTLENPTLDLDPSKQETLDVITATRAGVATYTDADGNIQQAAADTVRVDHVQGEELTPTKFQRVGYTDFSSGWVQGGLTISDGEGLNGEVSAVVENDDAGSGNTFYFNVPTVEGQTYTGGFWIRRLSGSGLVALYHTFSPTGSQTSITDDVTSEWTFVSVQFLGKNGGGNVRFGVRVYYTTGDSVEIAMPQVEEGTTATDFVANTTGSPKFIAPATYGPRVPMILVEPSATNLVPFSDINSGWDFYSNDANITQYTNDLGVNAYVLSRIGSNQKTSLQLSDVSGGSTTNATASLFYKNIGEARFFQFWDTHLSESAYVNVDTLTDEVHAPNTSASITVLGNGWRRLEWTRPDNTARTSGLLRLSLADSFSGRNPNFSGTGGIAFAGIQLEEGSVATSYIPTSGSTVQRQADDLVISGSDFTDFYNQSEGTFYLETDIRQLGTKFYFDVSDGTSSNRVLLYDYITDLDMFTRSGGTTVDRTIGSTSIEGLQRIAFSYSSSNMIGSLNGNAEVNQPSSSVPSSVNKITLGSRYNQGSHLNGHLKRLIFWPYSSDRL